jgi:hypothetical protein
MYKDRRDEIASGPVSSWSNLHVMSKLYAIFFGLGSRLAEMTRSILVKIYFATKDVATYQRSTLWPIPIEGLAPCNPPPAQILMRVQIVYSILRWLVRPAGGLWQTA